MSRRAAGWVLGIALLLVAGGLVWWWRAGHAAAGHHGQGGVFAGESGDSTLERRAFDLYFPSGTGLRAERRELAVSDAPKDRMRKILTALLAGPAASPTATGATGASGRSAAAAGASGKSAAAAGAAPAAAPASPSTPSSPSAPAAGSAPTAPASAPPPAAAPTADGLVRPFPAEVKLGAVELSADGTAYVDLQCTGHDDPPESGSTEEIQRVYSLVNSLILNVPQVTRVVLLWNGTQRVTFSGHLDTSRPLVADRSLLTP